FTAAARSLGLSKSAVSKQVARLEDRLGARLLNRTTRKLSLTEVGEAFYERCARIVEEAQAAEAEVSNLAAAPRGRLRVNAPMTFGTMHLGPAIADFMALYPELEVELVLDDRFVDLVQEGFDVAVRITSLTDSSLIARRIAPSRHVVCGAPAYFQRHGVPQSPAELRDHVCLRYSYGPTSSVWPFNGPDGPVEVPVNGKLLVNNGEVLREAALAGVGLIASPTFIIGDALREGRLKPVLCDYIPRERTIHAVYPHRRHVLPKVRAFVDFLAQRFGPEPYWDAGAPV
ncbi:MAG TPA: LysR family transcriptional regulator, partial [Alphaproteobacteria bacterium]|nr:LysR family transcriptional regulator [Alphaproteobacteria bacterium]